MDLTGSTCKGDGADIGLHPRIVLRKGQIFVSGSYPPSFSQMEIEHIHHGVGLTHFTAYEHKSHSHR